MDDFKRRSNYLKQCFDNHQTKCQMNKELCKIVQELKDELDHCRSTIAHYKQLLDTFNKTESTAVLYNALKITYSEIQNENSELKQRLLVLEENSKQERQKITNDYEERITKLSVKHLQENKTITNELHKKINCYESELADLKKTLEIKENYVNNQIQICQAAADLQVDEAEVKWKTLLDSINQKLKESNSTCINLRNQIITLRNEAASHKDEINKHVHEKKELEDKLLYMEDQLIIAQEKLLQNQHSTIKKYTGGKQRYNTSRASIYNVKENSNEYVNKQMKHLSQSSNSTVNYKTVRPSQEKAAHASQEKDRNYENLHAVQGLYKTKHNVRLFPLQSCSESKRNMGGKKRKLYNPNSTEYLSEMENEE